MFIVILRFSGNHAKAAELMQAHNDWIRRGFDDGVFLMTGTLKPAVGGMVLAHGTTASELEGRVAADPFVAQGVVSPEILEVAASRADDRLAFLA